MPESKRLYCATDKEIFDVLMSSKQRITESVMLELAKDRGVFYSAKDSREILADSLSLLPHDYHDLVFIGSNQDFLRSMRAAREDVAWVII